MKTISPIRSGLGLRMLIPLLLLLITPQVFAQSASATKLLTLKRDLAGVLGEVHYIRTLCNGANDQYWRDFMRDFLKFEADTKETKALFTKAFNLGYKFQSQRISQCDLNAPILEAKLAEKGRKISESIATFYMN